MSNYNNNNGILKKKKGFEIVKDTSTNKKMLIFEEISNVPDRLLSSNQDIQEICNFPYTIKKIGEESFKACLNLEEVHIPDTITELGKNCFAFCNKLHKCTISNNIEIIPEGCFRSCSELDNVKIPNSVIELQDNCFSACQKLKNIHIPDTVKTIGKQAFSYCKSLESFTFNNNITSISEQTFNNCRELKYVYLPENLTTIQNMAFLGCDKLRDVKLPNTLKYIGNNSFGYCLKMKNVVIPEEVETIDSYAFEDCQKLENVTILSKRLNTIGDSIFIGCKNIKYLNIPQGILKNKFFDFENMPNLKKIIYEGQEILNLTDKDKFIELVNNGKYIYMKYIDKDNNSIFKMVSDIPNKDRNFNNNLTKDFNTLINHNLFKNVEVLNTPEICLNMMSVLDTDTCISFLDLLYNKDNSKLSKIKQYKPRNVLHKIFNKIRKLFTKNIVDRSDIEHTITSVEKLKKIFQTITIDESTQNLNNFFLTNMEKIANSNDKEFLKKIFMKKENQSDKDIRKSIPKINKSIDVTINVIDVEADNNICDRYNKNLSIKNIREEER